MTADMTADDAPMIEGVAAAPGHDGSAELVVTLRYPNGASDQVTLDAAGAERLLDLSGAPTFDALAGRSGRLLLAVNESHGGCQNGHNGYGEYRE